MNTSKIHPHVKFSLKANWKPAKFSCATKAVRKVHIWKDSDRTEERSKWSCQDLCPLEWIQRKREITWVDIHPGGWAVQAIYDVLSPIWLSDPMDSSPPGSSVHGNLQARILEWVAMPSSRRLPNSGIKPRSPTLQADSFLSQPPGKPHIGRPSPGVKHRLGDLPWLVGGPLWLTRKLWKA